MSGYLVYKVKDKNKIKSHKQKLILAYSLRGQIYITDNCIPLVWVSTHCKPKLEKQDLQAGKSLWQNSNSTTRSRSKKQYRDMIRERRF